MPDRSSAGWLKRWLPLAALAVVALVALVIGTRPTASPTLEERTMAVAAQVRCPVCAGESAAQSQTPPSIEIRHLIRKDLAAGEKPSKILSALVASYGPGILEKPPSTGFDAVVWMAPPVGILLGALGLILAFRRWRPRRQAEPSEEDRSLVARALARERPGGEESSWQQGSIA